MKIVNLVRREKTLKRQERLKKDLSKPKVPARKEIQAMMDKPPKNFEELQKLKIPHGVITPEQWAHITRNLRQR